MTIREEEEENNNDYYNDQQQQQDDNYDDDNDSYSTPQEEFKVSGIVSSVAPTRSRVNEEGCDNADSDENNNNNTDSFKDALAGGTEQQHQNLQLVGLTAATTSTLSANAGSTPRHGGAGNANNGTAAGAGGTSYTPPSHNSSSSSTRRRKKQYAVSTQWERQVADGTLPKDINTYCCCLANRIGNMFALISYPDGTPLMIAGPCWPFCVFVTLPLILGVTVVISYFLIISKQRFDLPTWLLAIYYPLVVFVIGALCCVSCRDPGLMERVTDEEAGEGGWFWNEQVGSFRPPGALYCRECGVLIQDYDHLCPWTGTGVGRNNMLAFKVFVVSVNLLCYFTVGIVIAALLSGMVTGSTP